MKKMYKASMTSFVALAGAAACVALAGPLDPPSGPVAPTFKTLQQVEPRTPLTQETTPGDSGSVFKITQPGSYYLQASILSGVGGKIGIEIATSNVTVDLNGFTIDGSTLIGFPSSLDGIRTNGALNAVTIKNGTVRDFGGDGLDMVSVTGLVVTDVRVDSCGGYGIYPGSFSRVERCQSLNNGNHGFYILSPGTVVRDCTAALNGASGFRVGGVGARVERCTAESNDAHGIDVSSQACIENNICAFNGIGASVTEGSGIRITGTGARVILNQTTSNDFGVYTNNDNNLVYQNWASLNSTRDFEYVSNHGFAFPWNTAVAGGTLTDVTPYSNFKYAP